MMEAKNLTNEQKIFLLGLRKLDRYDDVRKERELNVEEAIEENKIKEVLFMQVKNYGLSLALKMTQKYRLPSDCYSDLCQDMAMIFYEKYRNYNPLQTTPTTYFVRYFKQVIAEYLTRNLHRLSQYDANNVLKVRRAVAYYESKGIKWTEEMLTLRTGLSQKVVHSTIFYAYASNYACIDEAYDLQAHIKTPEQAFSDKEAQSALIQAIKNNTSEEELSLLLMRINLDGKKELPYEEVANRAGISVREVKKILNTCICRLNQDKKLLEQFSKPTLKKYKSTLSLQKNTSEVMENQLNGFFVDMANAL